jgi:hypothetical protein
VCQTYIVLRSESGSGLLKDLVTYKKEYLNLFSSNNHKVTKIITNKPTDQGFSISTALLITSLSKASCVRAMFLPLCYNCTKTSRIE